MGPNRWVFPLRNQPWKSVSDGSLRTQGLQGESRAPEGMEDREGCTWPWGAVWVLGRYTGLDWVRHGASQWEESQQGCGQGHLRPSQMFCGTC